MPGVDLQRRNRVGVAHAIAVGKQIGKFAVLVERHVPEEGKAPVPFGDAVVGAGHGKVHELAVFGQGKGMDRRVVPRELHANHRFGDQAAPRHVAAVQRLCPRRAPRTHARPGTVGAAHQIGLVRGAVGEHNRRMIRCVDDIDHVAAEVVHAFRQRCQQAPI